MFHKGAKWVNSELYPTMDDMFRPETNIKIKGQGTLEFGVKYIVSGFGEGRADKDGIRKPFWEVLDKYNTEAPPIHIFKKDLNKLFDDELITIL